jgi:hypothetical protein
LSPEPKEATMTIYPARTMTVSIDRDWREVYDFLSIPENWPRWAAGLGTGLVKSGDAWTAAGPDGQPIRVRFSPPNAFGVLDHIVTVAAGTEVHMAMRVVGNATGAEVMLTVLRIPPMTEQAFAADTAAVARDLDTLKALLER